MTKKKTQAETAPETAAAAMDANQPFYKRWWKYIAAGAFMFFLLKGIGWLVLLGLAVWGYSG